MKKGQKLVLSTLTENEGQFALWRTIYCIDLDTHYHTAVIKQVNELKKENKKEYEALE